MNVIELSLSSPESALSHMAYSDVRDFGNSREDMLDPESMQFPTLYAS